MGAPTILFIVAFAQETNCYIRAVNNFQIMIANGGSMKCDGWWENVRLQIGHYQLKSHMFAIDMGGCDIVLGVEWLRTLGPILMDFKLCCTGTRPPQKNPRTRRPRVPGTRGPLGNLPKLLGTPLGTRGLVGRPQDVPDRFQGRSEQILRMF
jgi:hypothetical protein